MNKPEQDSIPVIDLFAGPGGLGEGFSAFRQDNRNIFKICLSVEKDPHAHRTLELRSFFRQFLKGQAPDDYYAYLRREITRDELFAAFKPEAGNARQEAWLAELGSTEVPEESVDSRIKNALGAEENLILIGGPPCQAYSTVGRSRNKGKIGYVPEDDKRHFLYRKYLRILSRHRPLVFVMENVKGILSSQVNGGNIFDHILADLHDPANAVDGISEFSTQPHKYKIYSLSKPAVYPASDDQKAFRPADYLIMSENYGIPQARHRVILFGVRDDIGEIRPETLTQLSRQVSTAEVLDGLPSLRSGLSREEDNHETWRDRVSEILEDDLFDSIYDKKEKGVWDHIGSALCQLEITAEYGRGGEFLPALSECEYRPDWYIDPRLRGICNHATKTHMTSDLHRYLFASSFAKMHGRSPNLPDFPTRLWPAHNNIQKVRGSSNFSDRFRVQLGTKPSTTVMSHIAKDGHYYIHYDPAQCRSLTVREAARLQTFPDNYFFEGNKTQQYTQVGNAVPPLLAVQIAEIVYKLLRDNQWIH